MDWWGWCASAFVHPLAPASGGYAFYKAPEDGHLLLVAAVGEGRVCAEGAADEGGDIAGEDVVGAGDAAIGEAEGAVGVGDAAEGVEQQLEAHGGHDLGPIVELPAHILQLYAPQHGAGGAAGVELGELRSIVVGAEQVVLLWHGDIGQHGAAVARVRV